MKDRANGSHRTRGRKAIRRRKLLAMLGAGSAGIAGCLGDGDDGGDGDGDGNSDGDGEGDGETENTPTPDPTSEENTPTEGNDDTPTEGNDDTPTDSDGGDGGDGGNEQAFCSELLDGEFERYDEDESPFVATFEYSGDVPATGTMNNEHSLTVRQYVGDRQAFDVFPAQYLQGEDSQTPAMLGELDGFEQFGELEFNGETVPLVEAPAGSSSIDDRVQFYDRYPYYLTGLPYNGKYYRFTLLATVQFAQDLETGVCEDTWDELAKRMIRSLELNEDTTVESAGVD